MNNENKSFLFITWLNAGAGGLFSLLSEPVLSTTSYLVSIIGGIIYIIKTLKNEKK